MVIENISMIPWYVKVNLLSVIKLFWLKFIFETGCLTKARQLGLPLLWEVVLVNSCLPQGHSHKVKCKQPHPGFELGSLISFPTIINFMLSVPPTYYMYIIICIFKDGCCWSKERIRIYFKMAMLNISLNKENWILLDCYSVWNLVALLFICFNTILLIYMVWYIYK